VVWRGYLTGPLLALGLAGLLLALDWFSEFSAVPDRVAYDRLLTRSPLPQIDDRLMLVNIDQLTHQKLKGKLQRKRYSDYAAGAAGVELGAIGWDLLFPYSGKFDEQLALSMTQLPNILAFAATPGRHREPIPAGVLPHAMSIHPADVPVWVPHYSASEWPVDVLAGAAVGAGHAGSLVGKDGVQRNMHPLIRVRDHIYPSLALTAAMTVAGYRVADMQLSSRGIGFGDAESDEFLFIPVDNEGRMWINPVVSTDPLLNTRSLTVETSTLVEAAEEMRPSRVGKLALVGKTYTGAGDTIASPREADIPGVLVIFSAVNAILTQQHIRVLSPTWVAMLSLALALFLGALKPRLSPLLGSLLAVVMVAGVLGAGVLLFSWQGLFLPPTLPMLTLISVFLMLAIKERMQITRLAKRQAAILARFVSPALMLELDEHGATNNLPAPRRRELTVMFADIAGFTSYTDAAEPEEIASFLQGVYDLALAEIFDHRGTLDKLLGDGIIAYWGAPTELEAKESNAVDCALALQEKFAVVAQQIRSQGGPDLALRCGIATGFVTYGFLGAKRGAAYTIIGRSVNLAARLESHADPGTVVIDRRTAAAVGEKYQLTELAPFQAKGIREPVPIWSVTRQG